MTSEVRRIGGLRPPAEVTGPLAEHAAAFKQMLIEQGYARGTISAHLGLMSRVSRWLDVQGLPARALADLAEVDRFFAERRAKGCRLRITARSLVPLLDFLRDRQVIGAPVVPAVTPAEVLLAEYRTYLEQERAATAGTVVNFTKYAGIFLRTFPRLGTGAAQQAGLAAALGRLTAAEVVTFVTGWASCRSPAYGQAMVYALRNLLRYLHARGLLSRALAEAVPTVPGWKPARPVRAVTGQQMAALLACCDRHSAIGRRDYAIVLLLTRLGLRASEVAGITLAGIDWRQGVLRVRGKGNILAELPLPADVGEAMAGYLRRGRVRCDSPHLFVRTKAPFTRLAGTGITAVVQRACRRAGLPEVGPHRLRHAVAAQLRREGASLSEIAQLLRHQDERTTQRYAADDVEALAAPCPAVPGWSSAVSPAVSVLHERAEQYVAMRRSLGCKFISQARMLAGFADYLAARGDTTVTVAAALAWATAPDPASAAYHRQRLPVVRGSARHLAAFDPSCQVPPAGLLPPAEVPAPYLYSPQEISALIHAAGTLAIPIQAATYHALICLLAVSGMRAGEALALDVADVDLDAGVITVTGKYDHTRLVPLHPTTAVMLRDYRQRCDQLFPGPATPGFFLSAAGTRPFRSAVEATFSRLLVRAGITPRHRRPPRIHDLRHSFAVATLIDWYRTGADVAAMTPLLSRILGHAGPQSTFYYLHAAPELLALAAARLHEHNTGIASTGISGQEAS